MLPNFKTYHVITICDIGKGTDIQISETESRIQKQIHITMVNIVNQFLKKVQRKFNGETVKFQEMMLEQLVAHMQTKLNLNLVKLPQINSKLMIDMNIKYETLKLSKENIRENLHDFELDKSTILKENIYKWYFNKI